MRENGADAFDDGVGPGKDKTMRTNIVAGTLALAGALVMGGEAQAAYSAATSADLNIRGGPGTSFPIVGVIGANQQVTVLDCPSSWCQIQAGAVTGWSSSRYLTVPQGTAVGSQTAVVEQRAYPGTAAGLAGGAAIGAAVGGPVGAVIGGALGAGVGSTLPPVEVRSYVTANPVAPVAVNTQLAVGATLPAGAYLRPVPGYAYQYGYFNDRAVIVEPSTRRIVYVYG